MNLIQTHWCWKGYHLFRSRGKKFPLNVLKTWTLTMDEGRGMQDRCLANFNNLYWFVEEISVTKTSEVFEVIMLRTCHLCLVTCGCVDQLVDPSPPSSVSYTRPIHFKFLYNDLHMTNLKKNRMSLYVRSSGLTPVSRTAAPLLPFGRSGFLYEMFLLIFHLHISRNIGLSYRHVLSDYPLLIITH